MFHFLKSIRSREGNRMKRVLLMLLVALFTVSILFMGIGCKTTTAAVTTAAETTAAGIKQVELVVWPGGTPGDLYEKWILKSIELFEAKYPNVKIIYEAQPPNEITMMMQTLLAARRGPDVMNYWEGEYILPLNDYVIDFKQYLSQGQIDEFIPEYLMTSYYNYDPNDKLLGLPAGSAGFHYFFYNKAMFADAGIDFVPTAENRYRMTWDEFIDACKKLKAAGITPIGWGNDGGNMSSWYWDPISFNYLDEDDWLQLFHGEKIY